MEYYWKNSFKLLLKSNQEFKFKVMQTRAPWKAKRLSPSKFEIGFGEF